MQLIINGERVEVAAGASVAAAVMAAGAATRQSVEGAARGPLCGMGICFECRVTINGVAHQRSCQIAAAPGMEVATGGGPEPAVGAGASAVRDGGECDLLVLGGGPAGMAGAARAAEAGLRVALVDDNPSLGGQIWRRAQEGAAAAWAARVRAAGVRVLTGTRIVDQPAGHMLRAEAADGMVDLRYRRLLLATGARERFLPFPGWTLPHVLGAGGLQAMAKAGVPMEGKRVLVAGAGPLLLAVAAYVRQHGADLVAICEQAPASALAAFAAATPMSKWREGLRLGRILRGVPVWTGSWIREAYPGGVVVRRGGRERRVACDWAGCGFHLVPNIELAQLLGCGTQNGCVLVDERQRTTVADVYCAGEPTGVGGVELALIEGEIAGLAAAGREPAGHELATRARYRRFAAKLDAVCRLRPELRGLARADTLVCRCEDVSYARMAPYTRWRDAKLQTRCGMGPCQGRVCGAAAEFLFGWQPEAVRPPIFPASVAALGAGGVQSKA